MSDNSASLRLPVTGCSGPVATAAALIESTCGMRLEPDSSGAALVRLKLDPKPSRCGIRLEPDSSGAALVRLKPDATGDGFDPTGDGFDATGDDFEALAPAD